MKRTLIAAALLASLSVPALAADKKVATSVLANDDAKAA